MFNLFKKKGHVLGAPAKGKAVPLSEVNDPTFAEEMLGKGAAVIPSEGKIYAPADGEIGMVFDTLHAVSMVTDFGAEVLIHVGLDTVKMNGEGFTFVEANDFTGRNGNLHFPLDVVVAGIHKELQAVVFFFQVGQFDNLRLALGPLHVIDKEGAEIAGDDPARVFGQGQLGDIAFGLLERRQKRAIRLTDALFHIFAQRLLLNQHTGGGNVTVDKTGVVQVDLVLKFNELFGMLHAVHIPQQRQPEGLTLAFLIAFARAISAATSTGALIGRSREIREGNFTLISRITDGQAELMNGASSICSFMYSLDASETSSAAALTSYTSSNPSRSRAFRTISTFVRLLYCA